MTDKPRTNHAELVLAAIAAEANQQRLNDSTFRNYVRELTQSLDLPRPANA